MVLSHHYSHTTLLHVFSQSITGAKQRAKLAKKQLLLEASGDDGEEDEEGDEEEEAEEEKEKEEKINPVLVSMATWDTPSKEFEG